MGTENPEGPTIDTPEGAINLNDIPVQNFEIPRSVHNKKVELSFSPKPDRDPRLLFQYSEGSGGFKASYEAIKVYHRTGNRAEENGAFRVQFSTPIGTTVLYEGNDSHEAFEAAANGLKKRFNAIPV